MKIETVYIRKTVPNGGPVFYAQYRVWDSSKFVEGLRKQSLGVEIEVVSEEEFEKHVGR